MSAVELKKPLTLEGEVTDDGQLVVELPVNLPRGRVVLTLQRFEEEPAAEPPRPKSLADRQFELAGQYPGEYVVLVGENVVHHSPDIESADRAFDQAFGDYPPLRPVMVDPDRRRPRRSPVVRGRAFSRHLP